MMYVVAAVTVIAGACLGYGVLWALGVCWRAVRRAVRVLLPKLPRQRPSRADAILPKKGGKP